MPTPSRTMLLLDGSLNALLAAAMWNEGRLLAGADRGERGLAWLLGTEPMQLAAEGMARAFDLSVVARSNSGSTQPIEVASSIVVLAGATGAARLGCSRLVWPVHSGTPADPSDVDLDIVAEVIDRSTLVGRLASLDARQEIEIQTPFVDFSDRQLADLAVDMGLDVSLCWWEAAVQSGISDADMEASAADAIALQRRWRAAMRVVGGIA